MANQQSFTPDEWTLLRTVPSFVAGGIAAAEPSGIFGSIKEASAGVRTVMTALASGKNLELFGALAADGSIPGMPDPKVLLGEGPRDAQISHFKAAVLERVKAASAVVGQKASPEEAAAYRAMIAEVAQNAAEATKEGGFLFFGGTRVSPAEQTFIGEVKGALGLPA